MHVKSLHFVCIFLQIWTSFFETSQGSAETYLRYEEKYYMKFSALSSGEDFENRLRAKRVPSSHHFPLLYSVSVLWISVINNMFWWWQDERSQVLMTTAVVIAVWSRIFCRRLIYRSLDELINHNKWTRINSWSTQNTDVGGLRWCDVCVKRVSTSCATWSPVSLRMDNRLRAEIHAHQLVWQILLSFSTPSHAWVSTHTEGAWYRFQHYSMTLDVVYN